MGKNLKTTGGKRIFGNVTDREIVILKVDEFKNKAQKESEKLIKKIPSLNVENLMKEHAEYLKVLRLCQETKIGGHLIGYLAEKYDILYDCVKKYHDELRKKIKELS